MYNEKSKLRKELEARKAVLLEKLRHNEFLEDKAVEEVRLKDWCEINRETTRLLYKIECLNTRIHNLTHTNHYYGLSERQVSSFFNKSIVY